MEFTREYQQELLGKLGHRDFLEQAGRLIHAEMFDAELEPVVERILGLWSRKKATLTRVQFRQLLKSSGVKWSSGAQDGYAFDLEEVHKFACHRLLRSALAEAHVLHEQGRFEKAVETILQVRKRFPSGARKADFDLLQEKIIVEPRTGLLSTGVDKLDLKFNGGVGEGEVATVMAGTGGGKTTFLCHLAARAVESGKKVLYVTLEVPRVTISSKMQARLTGEPKPKESLWKKTRTKLARKGGVLYVEEAPPASLRAEDIEALMDPRVKLLLVDYADYLLTPDGTMPRDHQDFGFIYEKLKRLALERNIIVWTASQITRSAYESSKIEVQDINASLKKAELADQVISLNIGQGDRGNARLFPLSIWISKNRHGEARTDPIPVSVDWSVGRFFSGHLDSGSNT